MVRACSVPWPRASIALTHMLSCTARTKRGSPHGPRKHATPRSRGQASRVPRENKNSTMFTTYSRRAAVMVRTAIHACQGQNRKAYRDGEGAQDEKQYEKTGATRRSLGLGVVSRRP